MQLENKPEYIDSHAHISGLKEGVEALINRAQQAHISHIINICTDIATLEEGLILASLYSWIHNAASTTPHDVVKEGEVVFPVIAQAARRGALVAIGETGLDYYYERYPKKEQKKFLRRYLRLALECKLPVIIHCREAFVDLFAILDEEYVVGDKHAPGVLHCFTGTVAEAEGVIARGWYLSLSGIVTFKKSESLREVARVVPLENLLIETDTPYLAPQSRRGKPNEPAYLPEIAAVIADLRGISIESLAAVTSQNARTLFRL